MPRPFSSDIAFVVMAAIALASCGGADEANEATSTEVDSNLLLERVGNDASALEAAANAAPILPPSESTNESEAADDRGPSQSPSEPADRPVLGETSGGDTGGNTVQGNVSGM